MTVRVDVSTIVDCVAFAFRERPVDLRSNRKTAEFCRARYAVFHLAAELSGLSSAMIGRRVGGRDGSTVRHGLDRAKDLLASDPDFAERAEAAMLAAIAATRLNLNLRSVDATAVAGRILANPAHEAPRASVNDTIALATRLLDLEDVAGSSFQLVAALEEIAGLRLYNDVERARRQQITVNIIAITKSLSSALDALGYGQQPEQQQEKAQ